MTKLSKPEPSFADPPVTITMDQANDLCYLLTEVIKQNGGPLQNPRTQKILDQLRASREEARRRPIEETLAETFLPTGKFRAVRLPHSNVTHATKYLPGKGNRPMCGAGKNSTRLRSTHTADRALTVKAAIDCKRCMSMIQAELGEVNATHLLPGPSDAPVHVCLECGRVIDADEVPYCNHCEETSD